MEATIVEKPRGWDVFEDRWYSKTYRVKNNLPVSLREVCVSIDAQRMSINWNFPNDYWGVIQGWQSRIVRESVIAPFLAENGLTMWWSELYQEYFLREI
jgi:hypothetical protein